MLKKLGILLMVFAMLTSLMAVTAFAAPEEKVIFIKDGGTGDGSSPENAMAIGGITETAKLYKNAPLYRAWEQLKTTGGTIVICGPYTLKESDAQRTIGECDIIMESWFRNPDVTITYTSVWDGVDYRTTAGAKLVFEKTTAVTFPTATVLKDLTVVAGESGTRENYIAAGFNPLKLDQGTNFVANAAGKLPIILGGHRNYNGIPAVNGDTNITVDIGNANTIGNIYGALAFTNKSQVGNTNITVKSGKVGSIYGDLKNGNGSFGLNGAISIDIQGGIITGEIAACNVGYDAACTDKAASIKISGGDFTNCTGIKATSKYHDDNLPNMSGPANLVVDCSAATQAVYTRVKALTTLTVTAPPADENPTEGTDPSEGEDPAEGEEPSKTGDMIGVVVAMMVVSGMGIVALKKREG